MTGTVQPLFRLRSSFRGPTRVLLGHAGPMR